MNLKSKFQKQGDDSYKKNTSDYDYYLNLKKFNLEKFKFEKENKDYLFSILPYKIETEMHPDFGDRDYSYFLELWVHSYVGINKGSYLCMKKMYGKECVICDEFEQEKARLEKEGLSNTEVWDAIKILAYKQRMIYHIVYNDKKYILDLPYNTFEKIWKEALDKKKKRGVDLFPVYLDEDGCTDIEFSYMSKGQTFYDLINYDFPSIQNYNKKYIEDLVSLEKLLIIPDQQSIKNNLLVSIGDEEEVLEEQVYNDPYKENEEEVLEEPVKKKKKIKENECPFETGFGFDWDEYEHCDKCQDEYAKIYEECKTIYKKG